MPYTNFGTHRRNLCRTGLIRSTDVEELYLDSLTRMMSKNEDRRAVLEALKNLLSQGRIRVTETTRIPDVDLMSLDDPSVKSCVETLSSALQQTDTVNNKAGPSGRGQHEQDQSFAAYGDSGRSAQIQISNLNSLAGNDRHSRSRTGMEGYLELTWA